ncbi:zinc knuckle protein, putative (macronuclear) [Tetrahymena thermophila SB210]|uniref:Zinc knuckle protein, putative n=1 Tax=Tetrahymena thermophila (strain SB210) TaxID=312017 RepID=Q22BH8_TETTS|nr:zinc knuckle protein, putative [Tetrahymena thermophila SB210]EAR82626.2 zinc knuckle protein, putative [Tetrahymena thermophila SB210]|eukprot:XP_001030289.2 zinc knuckle protein, putative [Tetrahymena thermophila SB210]
MKLSVLLQAIKGIDIYGVPIGVNFKSNEVHKTSFGALISAAIFILIALQVYYAGQDLISRNNPQVITSEQYVRNPERMVFDNVQQVVMMGLSTYTSQYISNSSIIQVSAIQSTVNKVLNQTTQQYDTVTTTNPLRIRPCTINDVKVEKLQDFFSKLPLSSLFCFDDNQQIYVEGDYSGDFYSRVDVSFNQCVNSTKPGSVICQPQKQIDKVLSNASFLVYMMDKILDPNNYEQPFDYQGFNIQAQATNQQSQAYTAYFENYYIESDVGLIQKDINKIKDFKFVGTETTIIYNNPSLVIKFSMRPYKNKQQLMQRRYTKLTDLLAQVGGALKFLTVVGFIICHPYAKLNLTKDIINSVFDFEENNKDSSQQKQQDVSGQRDKKSGEQDSFQLNSILTKNLTNKEQIQNDQNCLSLSQKAQDLSPSITSQAKYNQLEQKLRSKKNTHKMNFSQLNHNNQFIKKEIQFDNQSQQAQFLEQPVIQISKSQQIQNSIQQQISPEIYTESKDNKEKQNDSKSEQEENLFKTKIINRIQKLINPLKQTVQLKMKDYLSHFSNCSQQKTNLMEEGINKINHRLDIQNILHQLQEIEKLKKIVLDEDQIKLFEILPRPVLKNSQSKIQTDTKNQFFETKNQSEEEKVNDAYNSLCNILNKQKKSQRDLQLIQLLDNNMYLSLKKFGLLSNSCEISLENKYSHSDEVVEYRKVLNLSPSSIKSSQKDLLQFEQNQDTNSLDDKFEIQEEEAGIKSDFYFNFQKKSKKNSLNLS